MNDLENKDDTFVDSMLTITRILAESWQKLAQADILHRAGKPARARLTMHLHAVQAAIGVVLRDNSHTAIGSVSRGLPDGITSDPTVWVVFGNTLFLSDRPGDYIVFPGSVDSAALLAETHNAQVGRHVRPTPESEPL